MALDDIKKVAQAEAENKSAKEAAIAKGQEDISKAQQEAEALVKKARAEAQEQVRRMMAEAEQNAGKQNQGTLDAATARCASDKQSAQNKLEQAAKLITERVVNSQWQS